MSMSSLNCRYIAVHNPLDYKQAMNDSDAIRRRLLKYLLPVIVISVLFNVPKFFESTCQYNYEMVRVNRVSRLSRLSVALFLL